MRYRIAVILVIGVIALGSHAEGSTAPEAAPQTRQPASTSTTDHKTQSSQKAVLSHAPILIVPQVAEDGTYLLADGVPMRDQDFFYDSKAQTAATPEGPELKQANSPIPMRVLSFNTATLQGTICGIYKDVMIDLKNFKKENNLTFFSVHLNNDTNDDQEINIAVKDRKQVLIDDNYVVFPDASRVVAAEGPFVTIHLFVMQLTGSRYVRIPSLHGLVRRGGNKVQPFESDESGEAQIVLSNLKESVVVIVATNTKGEELELPVPLPVKGSVKGMVTQDVFLHFGEAKRSNP